MPHTHTMQSEIFNTPLKFEQALSNFKIIDTSDVEDPLNAIEFAAKLPFRTGVSKTIVLIPCGQCMEKASTYLDIQQLLFDRDIRLHVLQQQDFDLKKDTPTSSYIFGMRVSCQLPETEELKNDYGIKNSCIFCAFCKQL